jgi:hypothetical protein
VCVICRSAVPDASVVQTSRLPEPHDVNAIRVPSGDQVGDWSLCLLSVRARGGPEPSASTTNSSAVSHEARSAADVVSLGSVRL